MYTTSKREYVTMKNRCVKYMEQLEESEMSLDESSKHPETLLETKWRQNAKHSLTNVSDSAFDFFLDMDKFVRIQETATNLEIHGSDFFEHVYSLVMDNHDLLQKWTKLFVPPEDSELQNDENDENTDCTDEETVRCLEVFEMLEFLYKEVGKRYINMSLASFRKEYMRKINVQRKEAHRKQIKIRTTKSESLQHDKVSDKSVMDDADGTTQPEATAHGTNKVKGKGKGRGKGKSSNKSTGQKRSASSSTNTETVCTRTEDSETNVRKSTRLSEKHSSKRRIVVSPCGVCYKECETDCVQCDGCDAWHHYACVGLEEGCEELQGDWFCSNC